MTCESLSFASGFEYSVNFLSFVARKTSTEMEFMDLEPFCFRVPFHVKNEGNLLKVEVSGAKSRKSMGADRQATPGYTRKKGNKGKHSLDDDDYNDEPFDDVLEENDGGVTAEEMLAGAEVIEAMNGSVKAIESAAPAVDNSTNEGMLDCVQMRSKESDAFNADGTSQSGL